MLSGEGSERLKPVLVVALVPIVDRPEDPSEVAIFRRHLLARWPELRLGLQTDGPLEIRA